MNLFVTDTLQETAFEKEIRDRIDLFKKNQVSVEILVTYPDLLQDKHAFTSELVASDVINIDDFFRGSVPDELHRTSLKELVQINSLPSVSDEDQIRYFENEKHKFDVRLFKLTGNYIIADQQVAQIDYFDANEHTYKSDLFDIRGFKAKTRFYQANGNTRLEVVYNYSGIPIYMVEFTKQGQIANIILLDFNQETYEFPTWDEFAKFFINQAASTEESNIFILHPERLGELMTQTAQNSHKYAFVENQEEAQAIPKLAEKLNGVVVRAHGLSEQLQAGNLPIWNLPINGKREVTLNPNGVESRTAGLLLTTMSSVADESEFETFASAVSLLQLKKNNVTLSIFSDQTDSANEVRIREWIQQYGLDQSVQIVNDQTIETLYNEAMVMLLPNLNMATDFSLIDALSDGLPVIISDDSITSDVFAGDGSMGVVTTKNTPFEIVNAVLPLISDGEHWNQLSYHAQTASSPLTTITEWNIWQQILQK
ncbi:glycosyltransferase [Lacticaseibacillus saniviri]